MADNQRKLHSGPRFYRFLLLLISTAVEGTNRSLRFGGNTYNKVCPNKWLSSLGQYILLNVTFYFDHENMFLRESLLFACQQLLTNCYVMQIDPCSENYHRWFDGFSCIAPPLYYNFCAEKSIHVVQGMAEVIA